MKTSFRSVVCAGVMLGVIAPFTLTAQDASAPGRKKKAAGQSSVWKIEGEKCTVYLAGSVHLLRRDDLPLPKPFKMAYEDSDALVFEMPPFDDDGAEAQAKSLEAGSFEKGKSLKDELSKEGYKALSDYLRESGLPATSMDRFRPWMASIAITGIEMMKAGISPEYGVEAVLEKRAKKDKKQVSGLETIEDQLGVFEDMKDGSEEKMLMDTLSEAASMADQFPKMVRAWKTGNGKALLRLSFKDLHDPDAAAMYERILFGRNEKWIAPIEKLIEGDTNTMVVVGAAHLFGKRSVIDLLEKKGYKVERVIVAPKEKRKGKKPQPKGDSKGRLIPV